MERNRQDELTMELARGMAARILGPFVKGGIQNVKSFWPMPFDNKDQAEETPEGEELEVSLNNLKLVADKWLKG